MTISDFKYPSERGSWKLWTNQTFGTLQEKVDEKMKRQIQVVPVGFFVQKNLL